MGLADAQEKNIPFDSKWWPETGLEPPTPAFSGPLPMVATLDGEGVPFIRLLHCRFNDQPAQG